MTKLEFLAMFTRADGTWDTEKYVKHQEQQHAENVTRINKQLDDAKMAYKVQDTDGNTFTFAGLESGFPVYRCAGGSTHLFEMHGLFVIEQHAQ